MYLSKRIAVWSVPLILVACATPQPLPFVLVDSSNAVSNGTFLPSSNRLEVWVGGKFYQGFYVIATSVANTVSPFPAYGRYGRYGPFPGENLTIISSNSGRAHLQSTEGDHLNCEFLFEGPRVVGECKSPQGKTYQMTAAKG